MTWLGPNRESRYGGKAASGGTISAIDVAVAAGPKASEVSAYLDQALDAAAVLKNVRHGPTCYEAATAETEALSQELSLE